VRTEKKRKIKYKNRKKGWRMVKWREVRSKGTINRKQRKTDAGKESMTGGKIDRKNGGRKVECDGRGHVRRRLLFWNVAGMINKDTDF